MRWRAIATVMLALLSILFVGFGKSFLGVADHSQPGGSSGASWVSALNGDTATSADRWGQLAPVVRSAWLDTIGSGIEPPIEELIAVLDAVATGEWQRYFVHSSEAGRHFDRQMAQSLAGSLPQLEQSDDDAITSLSDERLFQLIGTAVHARSFAIQAVDLEDVAYSTEFVFTLGSEQWPYTGAFTQDTLFVPPNGRLARAHASSIAGTDSAACIRLRVMWSDGTIGHLRMHYFHDGSAWQPVSIVIGSRNREHWPTPLF